MIENAEFFLSNLNVIINIFKYIHTADFIKKVLSVYTHSLTTIYLSLSARVAKSTFFIQSPVAKKKLYTIFLLIDFDQH